MSVLLIPRWKSQGQMQDGVPVPLLSLRLGLQSEGGETGELQQLQAGPLVEKQSMEPSKMIDLRRISRGHVKCSEPDCTRWMPSWARTCFQHEHKDPAVDWDNIERMIAKDGKEPKVVAEVRCELD